MKMLRKTADGMRDTKAFKRFKAITETKAYKAAQISTFALATAIGITFAVASSCSNKKDQDTTIAKSMPCEDKTGGKCTRSVRKGDVIYSVQNKSSEGFVDMRVKDVDEKGVWIEHRVELFMSETASQTYRVNFDGTVTGPGPHPGVDIKAEPGGKPGEARLIFNSE